ncbi:PREDICTED: trichohyalin-like, partial [Cyphomyrmex costatus]|uniref:trichohyalin-like n=1 Tax=Cyphomyrmex costatus TaxID=456900 RepID=UPI00085222D4
TNEKNIHGREKYQKSQKSTVTRNQRRVDHDDHNYALKRTNSYGLHELRKAQVKNLNKRRRVIKDPQTHVRSKRQYKYDENTFPKEEIAMKHSTRRKRSLSMQRHDREYCNAELCVMNQEYEDSRKLIRYDKSNRSQVAKRDTRQIENAHNQCQDYRKRDYRRFKRLNIPRGTTYTIERGTCIMDNVAQIIQQESVRKGKGQRRIISGRYRQYEKDEDGNIRCIDQADSNNGNNCLEYYESNEQAPRRDRRRNQRRIKYESQQSEDEFADSEREEEYQTNSEENEQVSGEETDYYEEANNYRNPRRKRNKNKKRNTHQLNKTYIVEEPEEEGPDEDDDRPETEKEEELIDGEESCYDYDNESQEQTAKQSQEEEYEEERYRLRFRRKDNRVEILRTQKIIEEIEQEMKTEQRKKIKSLQIPMIEVNFEKINEIALIDTGAQ